MEVLGGLAEPSVLNGDNLLLKRHSMHRTARYMC
jgi:hypothetical protein